ncbi:MAG TPA: hypothetical protein VIJ19_10885 [Opitutaceae bacterium]
MNTHLEELACLYVLDQLGPADRATAEARILCDTEFAAAVAAAESALAAEVAGLPRHEPPASLAARIDAELDGLGILQAPGSLLSVVARWGIAAAIAAGVGTLAYVNLAPARAVPTQPHMILVGLDSSNSTLADLPISEAPRDADASFIQLASLAERYWKKPQELPLKMPAGTAGGSAYALFDSGSNQGFIAIRQLPSVEEGKRYHLWVVDTKSGQVREAGILPLSGSSRGLYFFSVAPDAAGSTDRINFFVTAEDGAAADEAQPRGKVVLGDSRI